MDWIQEKLRLISPNSSSSSSSSSPSSNKPKLNNFPPCFPLTYHNIFDCGEKVYLSITNIFGYFGTIVILLLNAILGFVTFVCMIQYDFRKYIGLFLLSGFFLIFLSPICFFIQYFATYSACASKSSARYLIFFFCEFIIILFVLIMGLGIPHIGSSGLITGISLAISSIAELTKGDKKNTTLLTLEIILCLLHFGMIFIWLISAIYHIIISSLLFYHWRKDNGSIKKAWSSIIGMIFRRRLTAML